MKENLDIRHLARVAEIPLWRVACEIGISEATFYRWMRHPLSGERRERTVAALDRLRGEAG